MSSENGSNERLSFAGLRRRAKQLVKAVAARDAAAIARVVAHHPHFRSASEVDGIKLADAQLVVAREHGHVTWAELKRECERRQFLSGAREERIRELVDAICGRGWDAPSSANLERAEQYLRADPELCRDDFVLACASGDVEVVQRRLDADPGLATRELGPRGWQPLVYVAYSVLSKRHDDRSERIAQVGGLLLERGASANSAYLAQVAGEAQPHPFPVLFGCIHVSDNLSLAKRLLDAGADPNDHESLYHAVERFNVDALELLYGYGLKPEWLSYCMLHQIDLGFLPGVRWFVDHGADPNVKHPWGLSALHWAIMRPGTGQIVELLLERGADARALTPAGLSALDMAERRHGKVEVVPALERHGCPRGERSPFDEAIVAAAYGDEGRARALLDGAPGRSGQGPHDRSLVAAFAEAGNHPRRRDPGAARLRHGRAELDGHDGAALGGLPRQSRHVARAARCGRTAARGSGFRHAAAHRALPALVELRASPRRERLYRSGARAARRGSRRPGWPAAVRRRRIDALIAAASPSDDASPEASDA